MNKVRIVVDSTTNVPAHIRPRLTVVPLNVIFGDDEYIDGVTMDHQKFYRMLSTSPVLPRTSQPSPEAFANIYRQARALNEDVVVLTISAKLSGTCQCAMIAAQDYPNHIFVVDTQNVTIGAGILAELALQLADEGLSAQEIAQKITLERENVRLVALLDTLEYLKRGGRISKTAAFAGTMLSIKPVIEIRHGEIGMLGKARGSRQGTALMMKETEAAGGVDFLRPLMLGYTGLDHSLLRKYIEESQSMWQGRMDELPYAAIGSVVGTHAGPGAIAIAFFAAH